MFSKETRQITSYQFQEHLANGSWAVRCGQTDRQADRHDVAKSVFAILRTPPSNAPSPCAPRTNATPLCNPKHPLQIMLFCKHLQAGHTTNTFISRNPWDIRTASQPASQFYTAQELGVPRVQSRLLWKANTRITCKNASPNAPSQILFPLHAATNASNKIHLSKEHAPFQFCATFRPHTPVDAVLPPQFSAHSTAYDVCPRLQTDS
jgi:hypothetical protein